MIIHSGPNWIEKNNKIVKKNCPKKDGLLFVWLKVLFQQWTTDYRLDARDETRYFSFNCNNIIMELVRNRKKLIPDYGILWDAGRQQQHMTSTYTKMEMVEGVKTGQISATGTSFVFVLLQSDHFRRCWRLIRNDKHWDNNNNNNNNKYKKEQLMERISL